MRFRIAHDFTAVDS